MIIHALNTRLFPKNEGAQSYRLTGIAKKCDWIIMTDHHKNKIHVHGNLSLSPKVVFLSLRSFYSAIPYFYNEILPLIKEPFILITGSEDMTTPNQIDKRWRIFNQLEKSMISNILNHHLLIHWFVENLDETNEKMTPLPVGAVFANNESEWIEIDHSVFDRKNQPLNILCSHRVRGGEQWETRRKVTELCKNQLQSIVTIKNNELDIDDFKEQLKKHTFTLCVQGGGLDPSPKVWDAILNGSIPIIKSSPLNEAYLQLPVVIIDDWKEDAITISKLTYWQKKLSPYYEDKSLRDEVLHRLSIDYWWESIENCYNHKDYKNKSFAIIA